MSVQVHVRDLPLRTPLSTGGHTLDVRRVWVLTVDHDGHRGLGEAAPLPGFGGETPEACAAALAAAAVLITPAFLDTWLADHYAFSLGPALEALLVAAPCARHAVEGALLDLRAQRYDQPLAATLADQLRGHPIVPVAGMPKGLATSIAVNALIGAEGDDHHAAQRAQAAEDVGFATLKLKLPADPDRAAQRVLTIRKVLGKGTILRADANAAWTPAAAEGFARAIGPTTLDYCEQPLAADALAEAAALRQGTGLRIAADESIRSIDDIDRVAAAHAADVVILKPMFLGGWMYLHGAVLHARRHGLGVVITTALDGSIARAAATHAAIALNLPPTVAHGLSTGGLFAHDLTSEPLTTSIGRVAIRPLPGLGIGDLSPDNAHP